MQNRHISTGYKTYTGKVLTEKDMPMIQRYNMLQDVVDRYIAEGRPVPEVELNDKHAVFQVLAGVYGY